MFKKIIKTRKVNKVDVIYGISIADPYRWLENNNKEVQQWIKKQNKFTRSELNKIKIRKNIKNRLIQIFRKETIGVPIPRGNRYFFEKLDKNNDLSILYVQDGLKGKPRILIDPNKFSKSKNSILNLWYPSYDGKLMAYGLSKFGNDQSTIYIMDVETKKKLSDIIPGKFYPSSIVWNPNGSGFWYTRRPLKVTKGEERLHQKVYYHKLGSDFKNDQLIFGENIAKEDIPWVEISEDGRYLLITVYKLSGKTENTALYIYDLENESKGFIPVIDNIDALFWGTIHRDRIFILTNHKASLWKLLSIKIEKVFKKIKKTNDFEIIIPKSKFKLENFLLIKDNILIETLENAQSVLWRYHLNGKLIEKIQLPPFGSITYLSGEKEGDEFFFGFTSFLVPHNVYRFDIVNNRLSLFKTSEVNINLDNFKVQQVWYESKDKTKVPMFLIHKKDLQLNGNNPTMLYGYGGFNISLTPHFQEQIFPFLENGGVYAITNIRGGGEFGEDWHQAGIRNKKQNSFDDFISAAEWLIKEKYTNPNKLAIFGWSNGGLLVASVMIKKPELFKAAVIGAPLADMLRYHLFFGGKYWIPEYGSVEEKEMFQYLLSYSPYHNIRNGISYPATLIITGSQDDRVHPMHAYKLAARLQEANLSSNPILLRTETKTGHSGPRSRSRLIEMLTDIWAFIFWQLDIK